MKKQIRRGQEKRFRRRKDKRSMRSSVQGGPFFRGPGGGGTTMFPAIFVKKRGTQWNTTSPRMPQNRKGGDSGLERSKGKKRLQRGVPRQAWVKR